jgi:thiol-disulfide isomerase/thioredoxin
MGKLFFISLSFLCAVTVTGQVIKDIKIPLYLNEVNDVLFGFQSNSIPLQDTLGIVIPKKLPNYQIAYIELGSGLGIIDAYLDGAKDENTLGVVENWRLNGGVPTVKLQHQLNVLTYFTEKEKCIILDKNYNHDFTDDFVYCFDKNKRGITQNISITIEQWHKASIHKTNTTFVLDPFHSAGPDNPEGILLYQNQSWYAGFKIHERKYYVQLITEPNSFNTYSALMSDKPIQRQKGKTSAAFHQGEYVQLDAITSVQLKDYDPILQELTVEVLPQSYKITGFLENYTAPDLLFEDFEGKISHLSDYKGKYMLLDFWGTWCNPCLALMPNIVAANKQLDPQKVEMVSIACEMFTRKAKAENIIANAKAVAAKHNITWKQAISNGFEATSVVRQLHIAAYPSMILISPKGMIIQRAETADEVQKLLQTVKKL